MKTRKHVDTPRSTPEQVKQHKDDLVRCIVYSTAHMHVTHSEEQKLMELHKTNRC